MRKVLWSVLVVALLLTMLVSGSSCSKTASVTATLTPTPTPTLTSAPASTPTPTPGQTSAAVGLVSPDELVKFLPTTPPSGWTALGNPSDIIDTDLYTYQQYASANEGYQSDDHMNTIEVFIYDYGAYLAGSEIGPKSLSNFQGNASYQQITVDGYPAWQREPPSSNQGTFFADLVVSINNRFAVEIKGSTYWYQIPFDQWTSLIDFSGIAALQ
jgi:hypothetical protein